MKIQGLVTSQRRQRGAGPEEWLFFPPQHWPATGPRAASPESGGLVLGFWPRNVPQFYTCLSLGMPLPSLDPGFSLC